MNPRKRLVPIAAALGLSLVVSAQPSLAGHCEFGAVALFATNSIRLGVDVAVTGDVVANNASPGPVLDEGVELALDRNATITGNASAFNFDLDNGAVITGSQTTLTSPAFAPGDIPAFLQADVRSDAQDVVVAPGPPTVLGASSLVCSASLTSCSADPDCPAGESCIAGRITSYRDILVLQGGTLVFAEGGRFDVRSITGTASAGPCKASTTPCRSIEFEEPTELAIEGRLDTERGVYFGPSDSSGIDASDIAVYVGGQNGATGGLFETPRAANVGRDSEVHASFYVPNGTFEFEKDSVMTGAILAADVQIDKGITIEGDSAFVNQAPTANPLTIGVTSNDPVTFEVTGSDPDGDSLTFSIVVDPNDGTATVLEEIQDPGQCSETVQACELDSECPGVETCVLPPVTRATVEYDPNECVDVGGDISCPTDAFTFGVRDSCGTLGSAVVDVNPDDPGAPPPVNAVEADDVEVDVEVGTDREINLSAGAPDSVASLTFAVETLPSAGTIADGTGAPITTVPYDLPSAVVVYSAPATAGADDFIFSARDSTTGSPPCGSPSCDTGTVNITIGERAPLAQPLSVETSLNQPVQITLQANPGGTGTGGAGPQAQQSVSSPGYTWFYEAQPISGAAGNGNAGAAEGPKPGWERQGSRAPQQLVPSGSIPLAFGAGWSATTAVPPAFFWTGTVPVFACDDNEDDCQGVFTFTGAGCLSVTDDFQKGDQFRIYDNGSPIGTTPAVAVDAGASEVGPDAAYLDPTYSSASFDITGTGSHAIAIEAIGSSFASGRGYIRIDSGGCQPNLEVTSFSAPDSAFLDVAIGDQIDATVTNTGFAAIPGGTLAAIGYYISADAAITTADRLLVGGRENLSQQAPNGLAVGESVDINLFDGANIGSQFPDESPLLGNVFIGVLVDEFNEVAESDEGDNTASEPIEVLASSTPPLSFRIETLPAASAGTLLDLGGAPIAQFQTFAVAPTLVFQPALAFTGNASFTFSVTEAAVTSVATVGILVSDLLDTCTPVGREPGCAPGGGGSGPQSQGPSQEELEREVAAGPSRGLTVTVEGAGSVATSSVTLSGDRVLRGLRCHRDTCNKLLPEGAEIKLYARPEGDDSEFVRWDGACFGTEPITTVRLDEHTQCTAIFGEKAGE